MLKVAEINPFIRYADVMNDFVNRKDVIAYDERFIYILKGKGEIIINGKQYVFEKNSVFYYPQGTVYRFKAYGDVEFISVNFDFEQKFSSEKNVLFPVLVRDYDIKQALASECELECPLFRKFFIFNDMVNLKEIFLYLCERFNSDSVYDKEFASTWLKQIIITLIKEDIGANKNNKIFQRVYSYIEEHYTENIDYSDISEALSYHPNYLSHVVKKETGIPLKKYITVFRLKKAQKLLKSGLSVWETAEKTGFCDGSYFCICFKKYYGITPTEYIKAGV